MNNGTLNILKKARGLISDPTCWTQGEFARSRTGRPTMVDSKYATCWCVVGAILGVAGGDCHAAQKAEQYIRAHLGNTKEDNFITVFNDTHSHEQVIGMLDNAIAKLEQLL